ncbi:hypothetical protein ACNAQJ_24620, partial [Klebsiella pneumoniae]
MTDNTTEELKEIFQKISKKVVKLIPYLTILSGLMVWSYLNNIGRLDLLIDSFSINIGLVSLLISAVVLSLAIAITLILPSSILIFHSSMFPKEGANKQVISSQADSLIKISRIWADFFPANTSNQPI